MNLLAPGPSTRHTCLRSSARMASARAFAASSGDANVLCTNAGRALAGGVAAGAGSAARANGTASAAMVMSAIAARVNAAARDVFMLSCSCPISGHALVRHRRHRRPDWRSVPPLRGRCALWRRRCALRRRRRALHRRAALRAAVGVALHLRPRFGLEDGLGLGTRGRRGPRHVVRGARSIERAGRRPRRVVASAGPVHRGRRRPRKTIASARRASRHCRGRDSSRASARWRCWSAGSGYSPSHRDRPRPGDARHCDSSCRCSGNCSGIAAG